VDDETDSVEVPHRGRLPLELSWTTVLAAAAAVAAAVIAHLPVLTGGDALKTYGVFGGLALLIVLTRPLWRRHTNLGPASLIGCLLAFGVTLFAVFTLVAPHFAALGNVYSLARHSTGEQLVGYRRFAVLGLGVLLVFATGAAYHHWQAKRQTN